VQRDFSGVGTDRPSFAVDNISICPAQTTPTISIAGPSAFCNNNNAQYIASITTGGNDNLLIQWKKNGVNTGTNSPTLNITGLVLNDQISCTLTSNATCLSSNVANSNVITIGTVNSSPTISNASITNASCPGARNGAIDLTISGGTPPYSVCWDTVNTVNGTSYGVTVGPKTPTNPLFGQGNANTYFLNGKELPELFLTRGITYSFSVLAPAHPFHISTDLTGGNANFIVVNGQTGAPTQNGTVTFTPNNTHPALLYYPCQFHQFMGWKVNIANGYCVEDPSGLKAGTYTVIVSDANGCTTTAQYQITEQVSSVTLASTITDASCGFPNGAIDLDISGGNGPYTAMWDTINKTNGALFGVMADAKTPDNPYPNLGVGLSFFINGVDAPALTLARGIKYTFDVFSPGHPFHISTDFIGGAGSGGLVTSGQVGAPNDNGIVTFKPNNTHPSLLYYICANHQYMGYNVNIIDPYVTEDLTNLFPGIYTVSVTDADGCPASMSFTVNQSIGPISTTIQHSVDVSCYGLSDGSIDLAPAGGTLPYTTSGEGPVFIVTAELKNHQHPFYGIGTEPSGFSINGVQGAALTLIRGITYGFTIFDPQHSLFISTDQVGGPGNLGNEVTTGVVNSMTSNGTLYFTPDASHPSQLYYQCGFHEYMGGTINIIDPSNEDLNNCMAGNYNLIVTDANGCTASVSTTISEPSPNIFYYDTDNDTYGSDYEYAIGCNPPSGFVSIGGDCNDSASTVYPGAAEICGNSVDENCDGIVDNPISVTFQASTDVTCYGQSDGSIDLTPASGVAPFVTSGEGPVFSVVFGAKNHSHPQFGTGSANGYIIDGIQGKELTLVRGITYTFSVFTPNHPFFISTSIVGGPGNLASEVTNGVVNSMTVNGNLLFTPNASHPNLLYYQCGFHNNMGWKLNIVDQLPNGDLGNCMSGNYSLFVTDANNCTNQSPVNVFINEPSANTFYYDGDQDTYGKNSESAIGCNPPTGFVTDGGDCNDNNSAINPGATEICGNTIDDDCDGSTDEGCSITLELKVFIEGYYTGLGNQIPCLYINGQNGFIPNVYASDDADSLFISLMDKTTYAHIQTSTGIVKSNGTISVLFTPPVVPGELYYIKVRHRNSIETWSASPVMMSQITNYDFTLTLLLHMEITY
jgi:hypothetical protein